MYSMTRVPVFYLSAKLSTGDDKTPANAVSVPPRDITPLVTFFQTRHRIRLTAEDGTGASLETHWHCQSYYWNIRGLLVVAWSVNQLSSFLLSAGGALRALMKTDEGVSVKLRWMLVDQQLHGGRSCQHQRVMDSSTGQERRTPVTPSSSSRYHRRWSSGSRDERYRSDVHTEAVQAALAKHKERKMAVPMPSKRRSLVVQTSMDAYTPPGLLSHPSLRRRMRAVPVGTVENGNSGPGRSVSIKIELLTHYKAFPIAMSSVVAVGDLNLTPLNGRLPGYQSPTRPRQTPAYQRPGSVRDSTHIFLPTSFHAPTTQSKCPLEQNEKGRRRSMRRWVVERAPGAGPAAQRQTPKYGNAELMETGDGVPVSSRVSAKIQQLVNTLKRPKRPPLREFFVDDFEELLEVQQPDPNQPKAEGAQMVLLRGEQLGVVTNWPPSLEAALQRWGTISPKAPCLTTMDNNGKPLYVLTYAGGRPVVLSRVLPTITPEGGIFFPKLIQGPCSSLFPANPRTSDQSVALVFPNNDPAAFMTAFYGCLLAEVVPVPIEVPLTRKFESPVGPRAAVSVSSFSSTSTDMRELKTGCAAEPQRANSPVNGARSSLGDCIKNTSHQKATAGGQSERVFVGELWRDRGSDQRRLS
ncbi:hypothetical protein FQN60_016481 [Etheostoma spectabile]|uniref:DMAP1-binding domain-containing protein n=1 Tax=Etheostoma spectabile TaxID=54343 RepID=A0A5J5D2A1_9PERO|nr:hypothetical protein FQN60_016481 [Etheostoma spectabile]